MPRPLLFLRWGVFVWLVSNVMLGKDIAVLKKELKSVQNDTLKANLLAELSAEYWYVDADSALYWGQKALDFSQKINYPTGIAKAYNSIAVVYDNKSNYQESEKYYRMSLKIYEDIGNFEKVLISMNNLGASYYGQSRYDEALALYMSIIKIANLHGIKEKVAVAYNNMGLIYEVKGNLIKALDLYMMAAKLAEISKDLESSSFSYLNAGYTYARIGNITKAMELYRKSIEYSKKSNDEYNIASVKMYMAELELESRPDSATQLPLLREALALFQRAQDNSSISTCLNDIGQVYHFSGDSINAKKFYQEGLKYAKMVQDKDIISTILFRLATLAWKINQEKRAIRLAEEARLVAKAAGVLPNEQKILKLLVDIYEKTNTNKYIKKMQELQAISDSLSMIDKNKIYESIQENYNNYKTILENDDLKRKEVEQLATIRKQENQRITLIIILIIIAAIATILFLNYRSKINANKSLEAQKQELKDLNAIKDKILSIIAHDLRGPLNSIEGLMTVLEVGMLSADEQRMLVQRIRATNANTLETLDTLLRWARAQKGSEAMDQQPVDMYRMVEQKRDFFAEDLRRKQQALDNWVQPGTAVMADENQLDFVIRNLVANAIKFTRDGGSIAVETRPGSGNTLQIIVRDTGIGMTSEQLTGLFHPTTHASTRGTAGEKGSGLGLLLSKEFVENNGGKIDVSSELGIGTEFIVTLQRP